MISENLRLEAQDFDDEMNHIRQLHLFVTLRVEQSYEETVDDVSSDLDPRYYDYGDVYHEASQRLQLDPAAVARHLGMMTVSRGVSLMEHTFALIASKFFTDPEGIVHTKGHAWHRQEAIDFFGTVLRDPVRIETPQVKAITLLRDSYSHGYGEFWVPEQRVKLASELMRAISREPLTAREASLGLSDGGFFIGYWRRDAHPNKLLAEGLRVSVEPSPLATVRILDVLTTKVHEAFTSASLGTVDPKELESTRFIRKWLARFEDTRCDNCGAIVRKARRS